MRFPTAGVPAPGAAAAAPAPFKKFGAAAAGSAPPAPGGVRKFGAGAAAGGGGPSPAASKFGAPASNGGKTPPPPAPAGAKGHFQKMNAVMLKQYNEPAVKLQKYVRMFIAKIQVGSQLIALREARAQAAHDKAAKDQADKLAADISKKKKAAILIQKVVRCFVCARKFKRSKVERKLLKVHTKAVVKIQAIARGYLILKGSGLDLAKLQKELRDLEAKEAGLTRARALELATIEDWKMDERKRIHDKYDKKRAKYSDQETLDTGFIEASNEAHRLRTENKDFRVEIETVKTDAKNLRKNNVGLERQVAALEKNLEIIKGALPRLENDHKKLTDVNAAYENKKQQYEQMQQDLQDKLDLEASLKSLYQLTAQEIVDMAAKSRREPDPRLIPMIKDAAERDFHKTENAYKATKAKLERKEAEKEEEEEEKEKPKVVPKKKVDAKKPQMGSFVEEEDEDDSDDDSDAPKKKSPPPAAAVKPAASEEESAITDDDEPAAVAEEKKKKKKVKGAEGDEEGEAGAKKKKKKDKEGAEVAEGDEAKKKKKKDKEGAVAAESGEEGEAVVKKKKKKDKEGAVVAEGEEGEAVVKKKKKKEKDGAATGDDISDDGEPAKEKKVKKKKVKDGDAGEMSDDGEPAKEKKVKKKKVKSAASDDASVE